MSERPSVLRSFNSVGSTKRPRGASGSSLGIGEIAEVGTSVAFSGILQYLDDTETKMQVKGEMTKKKNQISNGWYRVKTMSMEVFSSAGKITGCVNDEGHLKLQTWRDGVHKTSLNGLLIRGDITLLGKNGDGVPVKWIIQIKNGVSEGGGVEE